MSKITRLFIVMVLAVVLGACAGSSPRTYFYALETAAPAPSLASMPELSLGLGPVILPDTLERPQIVTQGAINTRELAEFHRWNGDLRAAIQRRLALHMKQSLGTERVYLYPIQRYQKPDYQIRVDVLQFAGPLGGEIDLTGHWTLLDKHGEKELQLKGFELRETAVGGTHTDQVAAMSRLVSRLGEQVARQLLGYLQQQK